MWKKGLLILGLAGMVVLATGAPAYAGNINAAEQSIISYYSGTVTYNGKTYKFTEDAKNQAYNKLMEDDVDLTSAEVKSAIRQANKNLKRGIDEGYLVEVDDSGSGSGSSGDDNSGGNQGGNAGDNNGGSQGGNAGDNNGGSQGGNAGDNNGGSQGGNTGDSNSGSGTGNMGDPGDGSGSGDSGSGNGGTGNEGSGNSGNGNGDTGSSGNGSSGTGNEGSPGNGNSGTGNEGSSGNGSGGSAAGSGNGNSGMGNTGNGNGTGGSANPSKPRKTIDLDAIYQAVEEDGGHNTVVGLETDKDTGNRHMEGNSFTVEQYLEGKAMAVTKDGEVLLEAELPIKNTGFYTGTVKQAAVFAGIFFFVVMAGAVWIVRSGKHEKVLNYIGIPLAFIICLASVFGMLLPDVLSSRFSVWKSVWISGAPQYSYAYANGMDGQFQNTPTEGNISKETFIHPLTGDQYGELSCQRLNLQAPLYYGDSDEILEKGAGTYAGGYLPGMGGTILIGAHDATFFGPLETIQEGDEISLGTSYGQFTYCVTGTKVSDLMDTSAYQITNGAEQLILYTCYPFGEEDTVRNRRFFVYAEKVSGPAVGE